MDLLRTSDPELPDWSFKEEAWEMLGTAVTALFQER
jgi:hypothetical protein